MDHRIGAGGFLDCTKTPSNKHPAKPEETRMKTFQILTALLVLASVGMAKPMLLHIESKCETCTPTNRDHLAKALRANLVDLDVKEAEPGEPAPTLRVFAIEDDSSWALSEVVNSPRGTMIAVTREHFAGGFAEILSRGTDSAIAHAKKTVEAAIQRAKDAANKKK